jgi:hypothetical protein
LDQRDIGRIQAHLKRTFGNPHITLKPGASQAVSCDVEIKGQSIGRVTRDEDDDGSFMFEMEIEAENFDAIQAVLRTTFGNAQIAVKPRPRQKDSCEVELNGEFIGLIYQDDDEDGSFLFEMAILAEDLDA